MLYGFCKAAVITFTLFLSNQTVFDFEAVLHPCIAPEHLSQQHRDRCSVMCRQSCISTAAVSSAKSGARVTYGMDKRFASAKRRYEEQTTENSSGSITEHDRTQSWLKGLTANTAKQAADPKRVDQLVSVFQQLMQENGLEAPLEKVGPCQYKLGSHKLSLKVGSNKLLVRCGGGYEDLMSAMEKMPQSSQ